MQEKLSGFKGIVYSRAEFFSGCVQYGIQGHVDKDGKLPGVEYFDESQLEVIDEEMVPERLLGEPLGGPSRGTPSLRR